MNAKTTLIFFTGSFPYSAAVEDSFILPELNALCSNFNKIVIVPLSNEGKYRNLNNYPKIEVNTSFAIQNDNRKKIVLYCEMIRALFCPHFINY